MLSTLLVNPAGRVRNAKIGFVLSRRVSYQ